MSDYSNVIRGAFGSEPAANVTANIDVDPDQTARAYALQTATGVPASIIGGDLDAFETQSKAAMANHIISNNSFIQDYVQSHPLSAQISNDDYGNLDEISGHLKYLNAAHKFLTPWMNHDENTDPLKRFKETGELGSWIPPEDQTNHPLASSVVAGLATPIELAFKGMMGATMTAVDEMSEVATEFGGDKFGKDIGAMAEIELMGLSGRTHIPTEAIRNASIAHNAKTLEAVDAAVAAVQSSTTRERAPDLFHDNFVAPHLEGANINISGPAALSLYGDKLPIADDGILGWVPNIREQLEVAKDTGSAITVPMSEWVAKVDPEVHKALHDDLSVVPQGVTAREAAEPPLPPKPTIEELLPQLRAETGTEPLFSIGDRKLQLQRMKESDSDFLGGIPGYENFHDFNLVNETGQSVGTLNLSEQKGGKQLYVEMVNGLGDYYNPNNFGPSLMRDLLRQIKAEFPNAESLTGHRVSGAREKAGVEMTSAIPVIRLQLGDVGSGEGLRQLLNGQWEQWSQNVQVFRGPEFQGKELELQNVLKDELKRLSPKANVELVRGIDSKIHGGAIQGAYDPRTARMLVALDHNSPLGTVRHEAIHDLYRQGFFSEDEWGKLVDQSKADDWIQKFNIDKNYADQSPEIQMEESIAEGFRAWRRGQDIVKDPGVFQRIADFIDRLYQRIKSVLGRDFNWEEVFKRVDEGQVGRRDWGPEMGPLEDIPIERASVGDDGTSVIPPFKAAKEIGMAVPQYNRYMDLIRKRQESDLAKSTARAEREQTKRQTAQWKADSEAMRPQVVKDLNNRPDVAADKFLANGELYGTKLETSYKLNKESLDLVQLANIPDEYLTGRTGVHPDQIAHLFGYQTGDQMLQHLAILNTTRKATGMGRERFMRQLVNMEIAKRMEIEHGFLEKNIAEEAKDQVLSENQLDLLHEETHALAQMAGTSLGEITREQITTSAKTKFDALTMNAVDSQKWLKEAGKHGKNAELALLNNKPADAFTSKQAQYINTIYATFARDIEKAKAKLDKAAKPFKKTEPPKNIEPEYLNHIQDLLSQGGYKVGRSMANIQENIGRRGETLEQFADSKLVESNGYRQLMIPDFVLDGQVKSVEQMTTWQFVGYKRAIDALIKNAKEEQKIIKEGETADRQAVLDEMYTHIETFPEKDINQTPTRMDKLLKLPRAMLAATTSVETFLNRLGRRDPLSVFNKYVVYPLASAANRKSALQREFGEKYRSVEPLADPDKAVIPPPMMKDPEGNPLRNFTRSNVMAIVHNAGNKSNWDKLTKGWRANPEALMTWLEANSTPDMWARAQHLGDNVFNEIVKLKDNEVEMLNGITVDKIPLSPFTNSHGTFAGWYHPLIKDPIWAGKGKTKGAYDDADFGHITTNDGYTLKRTGAIYPVDLSADMIPMRINQMLHDIAFQNTVLQVQKIFKDSKLSNMITTHYGADYNRENLLLPYLKDIAGGESIPSNAQRLANNLSETLRQNTISTYIGFNPSTVLKHGPTAWILSMNEVGPKNFLQAVVDLYRRSPELTLKNHEFAMKWSEELQRRERHWQDTVFGAHSQIEGAIGVRENIIQAGSWAVAKSDMASAKPTWLAAYRNAREDGLTHGEAVDLGDRAVRRAHGSTAITNLPAAVRNTGAMGSWFTSIYGFFGTVMQRRLEIAHDINDTFGLVKEWEFKQAAGNMPGLLGDVMAYVIWPTIVEEAVTGLSTDDHRGWIEHIAAGAFMGLSSSVLYLRDVAHAITTGQDPGLGLLPSAVKDLVKGAKAPFKHDAWSRQRAGKTIGDTLNGVGIATGMAPKTVDNAIHFGIDLVNNVAHPKSLGDWYRGAAKGNTKAREEK